MEIKIQNVQKDMAEVTMKTTKEKLDYEREVNRLRGDSKQIGDLAAGRSTASFMDQKDRAQDQLEIDKRQAEYTLERIKKQMHDANSEFRDRCAEFDI